MIVQQIIVHKPVYKAPVVVQHVHQPQVWRKPDNYVGNQEQYNTFMNTLSITEGDFVTLAAKESPYIYLFNVHYVAKLETDFDKLNWQQAGSPKPFLLVACAVPTNSNLAPWTRWDSASGLRLLSAREYDELVKPQHDNLQNSCIKHAATYQAAFPSRN